MPPTLPLFPNLSIPSATSPTAMPTTSPSQATHTIIATATSPTASIPGIASTEHITTEAHTQKRKRSPSPSRNPHLASTVPAAKQPRTVAVSPSHVAPTPPSSSASHLQINYLARKHPETLPLISADDNLPALFLLLLDYEGVLQRHESMASNLGAHPLGPILFQRFERLFDGRPRVIKTHGKDGPSTSPTTSPNVGWLDVVDFARSKPEQFNLEKTRDGMRVCQFYTKGYRVEISEEDYVLISSGIPQKMIPPQPIAEDEEKELGTLEILEKSLAGVVQGADRVSAKARQLNHRLKHRRAAILSRREVERAELGDRSPTAHQSNGDSHSPNAGFVAVNAKSNALASRIESSAAAADLTARSLTTAAVNGYSTQGASAATRAELLNKFHTNSDRQFHANSDRAYLATDLDRRVSNPNIRSSLSNTKTKSGPSADQLDYAGFLNNAAHAPSTTNSSSAAKASLADDSGPHKASMMQRMEQLSRGDRIMPPCDRCRRLQMDCLKNLTACMGCTKKHAKCAWKEVEEGELREFPFVPRVVWDDDKSSDDKERKPKKDWSVEATQGVRDEELLGEDDSDDDVEDTQAQATEGAHTGTSSHLDTQSHPKQEAQPPPLENQAIRPPSLPKPDIPIYRPPLADPPTHQASKSTSPESYRPTATQGWGATHTYSKSSPASSTPTSATNVAIAAAPKAESANTSPIHGSALPVGVPVGLEEKREEAVKVELRDAALQAERNTQHISSVNEPRR